MAWIPVTQALPEPGKDIVFIDTSDVTHWFYVPTDERYRRFDQLAALLGPERLQTDATINAVCQLHIRLPEFDVAKCLAHTVIELSKAKSDALNRLAEHLKIPGRF